MVTVMQVIKCQKNSTEIKHPPGHYHMYGLAQTLLQPSFCRTPYFLAKINFSIKSSSHVIVLKGDSKLNI